METLKITLPKNPFSRKELEYKLQVYELRLVNHARKRPYSLPQDIAISPNGYRFAIIDRLLRRGEVSDSGLVEEFIEMDGIFDEGNFRDAFEVILDYCETGGINTRGGTGLTLRKGSRAIRHISEFLSGPSSLSRRRRLRSASRTSS